MYKVPTIRAENLLKKHFGVCFPDDYLTFDLETTGFNKTDDLPIDFGWCLVRDRLVTSSGGLILNWYARPEYVDPEWLDHKLAKLTEIFALRDMRWHYSPQVLREKGLDPIEVLEYVYDLFGANRSAGASFVGHNAVNYDAPLLKNVLSEYLHRDWSFDPQELFDTGCIEKMLQCSGYLSASMQLFPTAGESMACFFKRASWARRPGVYWNMQHCLERYRLCEEHGIRVADLHGAEVDSYGCYLYLEHHRER